MCLVVLHLKVHVSTGTPTWNKVSTNPTSYEGGQLFRPGPKHSVALEEPKGCFSGSCSVKQKKKRILFHFVNLARTEAAVSLGSLARLKHI